MTDTDTGVVNVILNGERAVVDVDTVTVHPDNPRRGDLDVIKMSIGQNGFYGELIVQKSTGYIVAGNHRYMAATELGYRQLPVNVIDVDDATAKRILLVDNRSSDLGTYDERSLADLLAQVRTDEGLTGTGYDEDDLDDLIATIAGMNTGEMTDGQTPKERQAEYEAAGIRSVVLPFSGANYERVVAKLNALRQDWELSNNSDVLYRLLDLEVVE